MICSSGGREHVTSSYIQNNRIRATLLVWILDTGSEIRKCFAMFKSARQPSSLMNEREAWLCFQKYGSTPEYFESHIICASWKHTLAEVQKQQHNLRLAHGCRSARRVMYIYYRLMNGPPQPCGCPFHANICSAMNIPIPKCPYNRYVYKRKHCHPIVSQHPRQDLRPRAGP